MKSSLGMNENLASLLSYALFFVTGLIFFITEKESKMVKFHAMQSILFSIALFVISSALGWVPFLGGLLKNLFSLGGLITWVFLMYKAYNNEMFKLPIIGDIAAQQIN